MVKEAQRLVATGVQMVGLVAEAGAGVTEVVEAVHGRVAQGGEPAQSLRPYRWVRWSLMLLAQWSRSWPHGLSSQSRLRVAHAALNGIVGDHLQSTAHPWAQSMQLVDQHGREIDVATLQGARLLLFVHGLCMSERGWMNTELLRWMARCEQAGYRLAFLRYNSGRSIVENGHQLSLRLAAIAPRRLVLVGHSMGGLLMRAAYAHDSASRWLSSLRLAVYLGSPHRGAPLERLGERGNRLLALTPWSEPLMRLGAVRSQGIQDLRHGEVGSHERELPKSAHHHLVAAQIRIAGRDWMPHWLGDGLVPVRSALGQDLSGEQALRAQHLQRHLLPGLHHMDLLHHPAVLGCLEAAWQDAGL